MKNLNPAQIYLRPVDYVFITGRLQAVAALLVFLEAELAVGGNYVYLMYVYLYTYIYICIGCICLNYDLVLVNLLTTVNHYGFFMGKLM